MKKRKGLILEKLQSISINFSLHYTLHFARLEHKRKPKHLSDKICRKFEFRQFSVCSKCISDICHLSVKTLESIPWGTVHSFSRRLFCELEINSEKIIWYKIWCQFTLLH